MHKEIFSSEQNTLLPALKKFGGKFGLVGGTAIALHIGHRRSIDFDLFSFEKFKNILMGEKMMIALKKINKKIDRVLVNREGEYTFFANEVKITFFRYPFKINFNHNFEKIIKIPDLIVLAAMKAFALGKRAKWKDYVDLYFIIKNYYSIDQIIVKSKEIFGNEFNDKIFRTQLSYFVDVDYSEEVEFLPGFEVSDKKIKQALIKYSIE